MVVDARWGKVLLACSGLPRVVSALGRKVLLAASDAFDAPPAHRVAAPPRIVDVMQSINASLRGGTTEEKAHSWLLRAEQAKEQAKADTATWLLKATRACEAPFGGASCHADNMQILGCVIILSVALVVVLCIFTFLREDKEENITPLCPQLIVKDEDLHFRMPSFQSLEASSEDFIDVLDANDEILCSVVMDWPDPFRLGSSGVAATVRIQNQQNCTLATIVARNVAVAGQGLALCRAGCEIFGFVEPEADNLYSVRHRTGVELLTFTGNFLNWDVEVGNPVGLKVCHFRQLGEMCVGHVLQHVDAGLVICGLMAAHVHKRLVAKELAMPPSIRWEPPSHKREGPEAAEEASLLSRKQLPTAPTTAMVMREPPRSLPLVPGGLSGFPPPTPVVGAESAGDARSAANAAGVEDAAPLPSTSAGLTASAEPC